MLRCLHPRLARGWRGCASTAVAERVTEMQACLDVRNIEGVLEAFVAMKKEGQVPPLDAYNIILKATHDSNDVVAATATMEAMFRDNCSPTAETHRLFVQTLDRGDGPVYKAVFSMLGMGVTDIAIANVALKRAAREGRVELVGQLYSRVVEAGLEPDDHTFAALIQAETVSGAESVLKMWKRREAASEPTFVACSAAIKAFVQCGLLSYALVILQQVKDRDLLSSPAHTAEIYNHLLRGCKAECNFDLARSLAREMSARGVRDSDVLWDAVLAAYPETHLLNPSDGSFAVLEELRDRGVRLSVDTFTILARKRAELRGISGVYNPMEEYGIAPNLEFFNQLIAFHANARNPHQVDIIFRQMEKRGILPDCKSFALALLSCGKEKRLDLPQQNRMKYTHYFMHKLALREMKIDDTIPLACTMAFVKVYGQVRSPMEVLREILPAMRDAGIPRTVGFYNGLIACSASWLYRGDVFLLYEAMQKDNVVPDLRTYGTLAFTLSGGVSDENLLRVVNEAVSSNAVPPAAVFEGLLHKAIHLDGKETGVLEMLEIRESGGRAVDALSAVVPTIPVDAPGIAPPPSRATYQRTMVLAKRMSDSALALSLLRASLEAGFSCSNTMLTIAIDTMLHDTRLPLQRRREAAMSLLEWLRVRSMHAAETSLVDNSAFLEDAMEPVHTIMLKHAVLVGDQDFFTQFMEAERVALSELLVEALDRGQRRLGRLQELRMRTEDVGDVAERLRRKPFPPTWTLEMKEEADKKREEKWHANESGRLTRVMVPTEATWLDEGSEESILVEDTSVDDAALGEVQATRPPASGLFTS